MTEPRGDSSRAARTGAPRAVPQRVTLATWQLAGELGYTELTVEKVLIAAQVSRASFYQHFRSIEDCFLNAYRERAFRLVAEVRTTIASSRRPQLRMLAAIVEITSREPQSMQVLMGEALAGGEPALSARDALIAALGDAFASSPQQDTVDLPSDLLIGGVFRFLSSLVVQSRVSQGTRREVLDWAHLFLRPSAANSWSTELMHPARRLTDSAGLVPGQAHPLLARERILAATAEAIRQRGYLQVTIADIVAHGGVSRRHFYNEFPSKDAAATAAYERGFRVVLEACTPAYFSSTDWRERVWQAGLAFGRALWREPSTAFLGFVECHAFGRGFAARITDTQLAFTLFLEEGYRRSVRSEGPSRAASALVATTVVEAGFRASRVGPTPRIRHTIPLATYIALSPFLGPDEAGSFVASKLDPERDLGSRRRS